MSKYTVTSDDTMNILGLNRLELIELVKKRDKRIAELESQKEKLLDLLVQAVELGWIDGVIEDLSKGRS